MLHKYLSAFIVVFLVVILSVFADEKTTTKGFEEAREVIVMREIGHKILLAACDSTSRVLPVKQVHANEYQIRFEKPFNFITDSLIAAINRIVAENNLPSAFIVNIIDCTNNEVVFGYVMSENEKSSIIPCLGRKQAEGCYYIDLRFQNTGNSLLLNKYVISGTSLLALGLLFFGLAFYNKKKRFIDKHPIGNESSKDAGIQIGKYHFNNEKQCLISENEKIELSIKESKLLFIFANNPNQIMNRSKLQKEVWEDEGVIVGRSLDMFISKLRKKLENDLNVKIINIHGKGYKLEINEIRN